MSDKLPRMSMYFDLGKAIDEEEFKWIKPLVFNFLQGRVQSCQ